MSKSQPKKIGILGPFGFGNLGDAAIQRSMIEHIRAYFPDAEIVGYSMNPHDTEERHHIPAFPITRRPENDFTKSNINWKNKKWFGKIQGWFQYNSNPGIRKLERVTVRIPAEIILIIQAYQHLKGLDYLIISGGGQINDLWGGPWKIAYVLFKFTSLARLRNIKVLFVSVGVESVNTFIGKLFIKIALSNACYKSFRDMYSKEFLEKRGLIKNANSWVYPDLAHSLDIKNTLLINCENHPTPIVGLNSVPFYDPRYWPINDPEIYQNYLKKIAAFTGWLLQKHYRIKLINSDIYPDRIAFSDMLAILKQNGVNYSEDQIIIPAISTLDELITELNDTDFVIGSRLHSVLLAQRVDKPVLALSYQSKIDKLMEDTGQAEYCFPIDSFDVETIKQRFLQLEANCDTVKHQIAKRSQEYRVALDEQYTRIFKLMC